MNPSITEERTTSPSPKESVITMSPEVEASARSNDAQADYLGVAADIVALAEMRKGITDRLRRVVENMGGDPLGLQATLDAALTPNGATPRGPTKTFREVTRYQVPVLHALYLALKPGPLSRNQIQDRLVEQGYKAQSISPALSKAKQAGLCTVDNHNVYRLVPEVVAKVEEVVIRPGEQLTDRQLQRVGELRGK